MSKNSTKSTKEQYKLFENTMLDKCSTDSLKMLYPMFLSTVEILASNLYKQHITKDKSEMEYLKNDYVIQYDATRGYFSLDMMRNVEYLVKKLTDMKLKDNTLTAKDLDATIWVNKKDIALSRYVDDFIILKNKFVGMQFLANTKDIKNITGCTILKNNNNGYDIVVRRSYKTHTNNNVLNFALHITKNAIGIVNAGKQENILYNISQMYNMYKDVIENINSEDDNLQYYAKEHYNEAMKNIYRFIGEFFEKNILSKGAGELLIYNIDNMKELDNTEKSFLSIIYNKLEDYCEIYDINVKKIRANFDLFYKTSFIDNHYPNKYYSELDNIRNYEGQIYIKSSVYGTILPIELNIANQFIKHNNKLYGPNLNDANNLDYTIINYNKYAELS